VITALRDTFEFEGRIAHDVSCVGIALYLSLSLSLSLFRSVDSSLSLSLSLSLSISLFLSLLNSAAKQVCYGVVDLPGESEEWR
jgi:hypothetical protein